VQPLPALVADAPSRAESITVAPLWIAGEQLTWDVSWRGLSVGRAHLTTGQVRPAAPSQVAVSVRSRLTTHGIAAKVSNIHHELATIAARELRERDHVHSIHSALATVRAWVARGRSGYLVMRYQRAVYRLDVARPVRVASQLRVDCRLTRVRANADARPLAIALLLSDDAAFVPMSVEVTGHRGRVTATLIERAL